MSTPPPSPGVPIYRGCIHTPVPKNKYVITVNMEDALTGKGYTVVPGILTPTQCTAYEALFYKTVSDLVPAFKYEDPSTYGSWFEVMPKHSMLAQNFGVGQSELLWKLRLEPGVQGVFATIWGVRPDELVSSFDGFSFHVPPEHFKGGKGFYVPGRGRGGMSGWLHADQSFCRPDLECVQSWVTPLPVDEGDGTLVVLEGSHVLHGKCPGDHPKEDWNVLTDEQLRWYLEQGCTYKAVTCPAGSMVLWDSRTIHAGREPVKGRTTGGRFRMVAYICMVPRNKVPGAAMKRRIKNFENGRTMSHNPARGRAFPHRPRFFTCTPRCVNDVLIPDTLKASPDVRRLVGYTC